MFDDDQSQNDQTGQIIEPASDDSFATNGSSSPVDGISGPSGPSGGASDSGKTAKNSSAQTGKIDLETPELAATTPDDKDGLLAIKQEALQQLNPLVDKLDQTPEEKFKTIMMMIQASDDQSLIKIAYRAVKGIEDEKERAQGLLDIINEINYFTQQKNN